MKIAIYAGALLLAACNSAQQNISSDQAGVKGGEVSPVTYANTITEGELKDHLYTYASDEFKGRDTGTESEKMATDYLTNAYKEMGIEAAQGSGKYLQEVPLMRNSLPTGTIELNGKTLNIGEDIFAGTKMNNSEMTAVHAGYGIETDTYSDYANIDVAGKAVIIKAGEPKNEDGSYVISGTSAKSDWSNWRETRQTRIDIAMAKGATAVIYLDDELNNRYRRVYDYMKKSDHGGQLTLVKGETMNNVFFASEDLLKNITTEEVTLKVNGQNKSESVSANNVVAFIEGKSKPNEYIVISAHLDHVGVGANGEVYNGADDDGSGTVAILEIAEAFQKASQEGNGPERSIVFLHVTGEEKGLFGSEYYTSNPVFPLENTVVDLNIDMVGRIDPKREGDRNYIYLIGSDKLSTELHELSEEVNSTYTNIELDYTYNDENDPNRFYYRSDHYNFAKNNVPIIFYFNGTHDDYHKPSDTPDKINYDLLTNRAKLVFHTAWEIANRPTKVKVDKADVQP